MNPALCLVESNRLPGNTVDLMRSAAGQGLDVVLVTSDPSTVAGLALGELARPQVVAADTLHGFAVADALRDLNRPLAGVTTAHEFFAPVAAEAAQALGLPGPDPDAVWTCRFKDRLRERLRGSDVAQPEFRICDTAEEAARAAKEIGWPVIVKPVALADSIGVALCSGPEQVTDHMAALLHPSRYATRRPVPGREGVRVLVEAYSEGREFTVEVLSGVAIDATETRFGPLPGFVEHQHVLAEPRSGERAPRSLLTAAERACAAIGLVDGMAHVELRLVGRTPVLVEINPRLAGGRIPELYRSASGRDLWRCAVLSAITPGAVAVPMSTRDDAGVLRHLRLAGDPASEGCPVPVLHWRAPASCHVTVVPDAVQAAQRPSRTSDSIGWAAATAPTVADCNGLLDEVWTQLDAQIRLWPPLSPVAD